MFRIFAVAVIALGFAAAPAVAQTIIPLDADTLALSHATLENGVINFNDYGGTATIKTLPLFLTQGQNYILEITGSDGPGASRAFSATYAAQRAEILNFDSSQTLSFLVMNAAAGGQLTLTYDGNNDNNFKPASISSIRVLSTPGPIAGAGLPALLGLAGGIWFVRRRRKPLSA